MRPSSRSPARELPVPRCRAVCRTEPIPSLLLLVSLAVITGGQMLFSVEGAAWGAESPVAVPQAAVVSPPDSSGTSPSSGATSSGTNTSGTNTSGTNTSGTNSSGANSAGVNSSATHGATASSRAPLLPADALAQLDDNVQAQLPRTVPLPLRPPPERALLGIVLLAGIIMLSVVLVGFVIIWGHRTRRLIRAPFPHVKERDELWFLKPSKKLPSESARDLPSAKGPPEDDRPGRAAPLY